MGEGQREQWWVTFHQLMAELTGHARRHRSWRTWGPGVALVVAFLLLTWLGWAEFDPTVNTGPLVPFWLLFGLIGLGAVLMLGGSVLSWRSRTVSGSPFSPTAILSPDQQRRCLALVDGADPADPHQLGAAADLARRVSVQRSHGLFNAAFVLLMLSLALDGDNLLMSAASLLVLLAHLGLLVSRELRVRAARRFLRVDGQFARVAAG